MKIAIYPGSFDPITNGHLDIIRRSSKLFDKVIVGVLVNVDKKGLFNIEERVELIERVVSDLPNVQIKSFHGLLIDFMREEECKILIKGLRNVTDFDYEYQMAQMNKKLDNDVETLFMMADGEYSYISSSSVKQVGKFNGNIRGLIPDSIVDDFEVKIKDLRG